MKRMLALLLVALQLTGLTACRSAGGSTQTTVAPTTTHPPATTSTVQEPEREGSGTLKYTLNEAEDAYHVRNIIPHPPVNGPHVEGAGREYDIVIPETYAGLPVKGINRGALGHNYILSVDIPQTVDYIETGIFMGCTDLASIVVDERNPVYHSSGNCLIDTAAATLMAGCKTSVIPDDGSVTAIAEEAFKENGGLTQITVPNTVTTIGNGAFQECTALKEIIISDSVTDLGWDLLRGCISLTDAVIGSGVTCLPAYTFGDCRSLERVVLPESLVYIENHAFEECHALTSLVLPTGLKSIASNAFAYCTGLTELVLPAGLETLDMYAFRGCTALTTVTFQGTVEQWNEVAKEVDWDAESGITQIYCAASDSYVDTAPQLSAFGTLCGTHWDTDIPMTRINDTTWETAVLQLTAGEEFIIRKNASYTDYFGINGELNGSSIPIEADGSYIIQLIVGWDRVSVNLLPAE